MYNELLSIGPFTVYGYGLMIAIGILAAYFTAEFRARRKGLPYEHVLSLVLYCALGGILSAKLLFWITQWKEIWEHPGYLLETLGDGFVVYGGIIGGILTGFLYCGKHKLSFFSFFDLVMPSVALAQGFGRIGCFLAGCCYGRETAGKWSIVFSQSEFAPNGTPLIPVQLYSSFLDFLNAGVLIWLSGRTKKDGRIAAFYMVFYSTGRFAVEFLRGDLERGRIGIFSTSQLISIGILSIGVFLLFSGRNEKRTFK